MIVDSASGVLKQRFSPKRSRQRAGNAKHAAFTAGHIFAKDDNAGIAFHFFRDGMIQRVHEDD